MRTKRIVGSLIFIATLTTAVSIYAQRMHSSRYHYDPSKVTTVTGEITAIESTARAWGHDAGTHIVIKTDSGSLNIYLGPSSFIKDKISFAKGDRIEVTGARFDDGGKPGIVAREVKKGSATVTLRDSDGTPLWAGRGWMHRR